MAADPAVKVHLYGKPVRPGRKIGHVTVLGSDMAELRDGPGRGTHRGRAGRRRPTWRPERMSEWSGTSAEVAAGRGGHGQRLGLAGDAGRGRALAEFGVAYEADVVSAHRMPHEMIGYGAAAAGRGLRVIIAGAGGAAHLPGMVAALTPLPVIGVPVPRARLDGLDALLSIVQMPAGVPVATVAVGGARNAGLLAVRILARPTRRCASG